MALDNSAERAVILGKKLLAVLVGVGLSGSLFARTYVGVSKEINLPDDPGFIIFALLVCGGLLGIGWLISMALGGVEQSQSPNQTTSTAERQPDEVDLIAEHRRAVEVSKAYWNSRHKFVKKDKVK